MHRGSRPATVEEAITPHVAAAYELAVWLVRDPHDAQDVVQEAWLRAYRFFDTASSPSIRSWFLAIVRNVSFSLLERRRGRLIDGGDALEAADDQEYAAARRTETPEASLLRVAQGQRLADALHGLPSEFREVFVLRELEGLSYKEIAAVAGIPIGTVMSRLSRARNLLQRILVTDRLSRSG